MPNRKILGLFVILLCLMGTTLTGCSALQRGNKASSGSLGNSRGASNSSPYNLVLYYPGTVQPDQAIVEKAINAYLTRKINATLELHPVDWGQWPDKSNLLIAAREPVDIYFTADWSSFSSNVSKGAFMDLDPLLPQYGQGILHTLDPLFLRGSEINGKHYGLPANKELASEGGIIFRKDIADKLGITDRLAKAKTIADLEPLLKIVKRKTNLTPLYLTQGENFNSHYYANYDYMGDANIPGLILKDGTGTKVVSRFELPRYLQTLAITRKFMLEGLINQDAATAVSSTTDVLMQGNAFAIVAPLKPGKDKELELAADMVGKLQQLPMTERTISTDETTGSMLAISTTSADPGKAMMFLNLLYTDKYLLNLLDFGIQGTHYVKESGDIIRPTAKTNRYDPGNPWMFGNQFLTYLWTTEAPDKWAQYQVFNAGARLSPAFGFTFNAEPVKTEAAAAVNIRKQYDPALDTGSVDPAAVLPVYEEKLKAAGLDRIIAEKQRQLDAFLARRKASGQGDAGG